MFSVGFPGLLGISKPKMCYPWHFPFGMTKASRIDPDPLPVSAVGEVLSGGITLFSFKKKNEIFKV